MDFTEMAFVLMTLAVGFPDHPRPQMQVLTYYLTYYGTHFVGQRWTPMDSAPCDQH